jgi:hypothetical protein
MKLVFECGFLCLICCLVTLAGCGRDSVDAVPRNSRFKPVLGVDKAPAATPRANGLDFSFLNRDHFACICINVEKVILNSDLADVPWDSLEKQLEKLVGQENALLSGIARVWIVLDRQSFALVPNGEQTSPMVVVIDYKNPFNDNLLSEAKARRIATEERANEKPANEKPASEKPASEANGFSVKKISDQRIAFGSRELLDKLNKESSSSSLANELKRMKLDSDVEGVISLAPIRSTLQSAFDIAATFGGESVAKFSQLPEVTQRIEFEFSLDAKDMLVATIFIDDDELTKEIARMASDASTQENPAFGGGFPFGQVMGGQPPPSMVPETSSGLMEEVGKEIKEKELFTVKGADRKVTFSLQRPSKLNELITAAIDDGKRQFELADRVQKLRLITAAMQKYQDKFGSFPPAGIELDNADGLPDQFNWRVGLLPFLGEQDLYDQFDFEQPWDSEANLQVANQIPDSFAGLAKVDSATRFHVVGGELGLYKEDRIPRLSDVTDKKIWTAVVIEGAPNSAVVWTQPGSLPISEADIAQFGNEDERGILFSNAAFKTRIIKKDRERLRAILTPDGNEGLTKMDFLPVAFGQ